MPLTGAYCLVVPLMLAESCFCDPKYFNIEAQVLTQKNNHRSMVFVDVVQLD
jgi:hypothetical protein